MSTRRDGARGPIVRSAVGVVVVALVGLAGCTSAAGGRPGPDDATLLPGVVACEGADDPIAAFWGSDEGVGTPGRHGGSPDGGDIWTITAQGRAVAITDDSRSRDPWMSADGNRIYFARSVYGNLAGAAAPGTEIWRYDVGTGVETMIVAAPTDDEGQEVTDAEESPDGSRIVYSAALTATQAWPRLYMIDVDRPGQPTALTSAPTDGSIQFQQEPTFSPDGSSLAYINTRYEGDDQLPPGQVSIRVIDMTTMEDSELYTTTRPAVLRSLEWSADGASLLAVEGFSSAVAINAETGARTVMASNTTDVVTSSSADGQSSSGIGSNWASGGPGEEPATLTTWRDTSTTPSKFPWKDTTVTSTQLPVHLSFAVGLTIADCAYTNGS